MPEPILQLWQGCPYLPVDELKSEAMQLVDQKERALLAERAEKEQARGANEELSREVSVLQAKWPAAS